MWNHRTDTAGHAGQTLGLCAVALLGYLLLGQSTLYKGDGQAFVASLASGTLEHPYHILYPWLLHGTHALLAPLGLDAQRAATVASALGTAVGVALLHRAALHSGLGARDALLAAALIACAPAVVFFATVVEVHGPFLAFAGGAWLAAAHLANRTDALRGAACGVACGLAAAAHALGHLLPGAIVLWSLSSRRDGTAAGRHPPWRALGALTAMHLLTYLGLDALLRPEAGSAVEAQIGFLDQQTSLREAGSFPGALAREWLLPYLPVSIAWLAAPWRRGMPWHALALALSLALYASASLLLLGADTERGAYFAPLAFPAAVLAARALPLVATLACVALAAALAVAQVAAHDRAAGEPGLVAGMRAASAGERPFFILGGHEEVNRVVVEWPEARFVAVYDWMQEQVAAMQLGDFTAAFERFMARRTAEHETVYLTAAARRALDAHPVLATFVREHLDHRYRLVPVDAGAFRAVRLVPAATDPQPHGQVRR